MPSHPPFRRALIAPFLTLLLLGPVACGDPFEIPPASFSNTERIVILWGLTGTPINTPSAFDLLTGREVRTDRTPDFDFAIEFAPDSALDLGTTGDTILAILPRGVLGFGEGPGALVIEGTSFDSLKLAPETGYITDAAVRIDSGDVVVVSSRLQTCNFGLNRHLYAKFRVDQIDRTQRRISTSMIYNPNCGYRSLTTGIPTQ